MSQATDDCCSCASARFAECFAQRANVDELHVSSTKKIFALVALVVVAACSQEPPRSTTPLVEQSAADPKAVRIEKFDGKFAPGGISASYRATFSDGHITSLAETREPNARTGAYEFRGARLMKYHGAALGSAASIELEFDQQGKVLVSRAGDKEVAAEEISAIRDRAQSLRSHAVAQRDVQGHDKP
jgi:hypothetical protein